MIAVALALAALAPPASIPPASSPPVSSPSPAPAAERVVGLRGVENVARVAPGIYRGSAPTEAGLDALRGLGIRTVINLRHYHGGREAEGCRRRGMSYVRLMLESSDAPSDEDVRRFLAIVTDPAQQPVYFHCWRGKDRTGAMCAAYRMAVEDWPLEHAVAEMEGFGFFRGWTDLRAFVERFATRRELFAPPAELP
jgi:hypothetical protein